MQIIEQAKIAVIGCGRVGMSVAYSLLHRACVQELVLLGRDLEKTQGEALDLDHGSAFLSRTKIVPTDSYQDLQDSDIVVFTAGASQKPGETRLDLTRKNLDILSEALPQIAKYASEAILIIVTNPVDVLVQHAVSSGIFPRNRVISTGTMLDTARFRFFLGEKAGVNAKSVHACLLGEHGDHSVAITSSGTIGGQLLSQCADIHPQDIQQAYEYARDAAYNIIQKKGSTHYAIGAVTSFLIEVIIKNQKKILPVSVSLNGEYGLHDVALSVPCVVDRTGVERVFDLSLSEEESHQLQQTAEVLRSVLREASTSI